MDRLLDFTGKVALVTGGSRGLGRQMALALAERGADVVITSRKFESCEIVASEIEALGCQALPYSCHVGRWDELEKLVDAAYKHFGRIDILINNAGMSPRYSKLSDISEDLFNKVVDVNLKGPFRLMAIVGERMSHANGGSIINISSATALRPSPGSEPYASVKAGLNVLTSSFAAALAPKVRVNSIIAGAFLTDIAKAWDMDAFRVVAEQSIAARRAGDPEEIIGAALYLASPTSTYTTGATLRVDGGTV